ncbi:exodeoxyribonuclease III [Enterobacteriaceae endosymbiont of Plateumaris sericea]|uniref:exodeoxyribonuclease III n=1 Tax=Enterobacteriaceae endosymbiont of Plateumaris sericea TaxID=2675797 RepID=UPI0014490FDF|nr:exodeoxyribonuclease III [Enterobacteriaceae endosymbiont of Plateumaris sericea]QJC29843.1 exodeoxyribonuclease III [Enterobacteriaceae endosymbiont of Plateumaris sericea]
MKFLSFNINGIRAHIHQLESIINLYNPDIIGLQETKVENLNFPKEKLIKLGYNVFSYGEKRYYGVALLSKYIPLNVQKGFLYNQFNKQKRLIIIDIPSSIGIIKIINCYFPQGDNRNNFIKFSSKINFFKNLQQFLEDNVDPNNPVILMGDINVSISDLDIGIGEINRKRWLKKGKCSFLPEERICINKLLKWGLFDIWRIMNPKINNVFSWFDYRSKGYLNNRGLRVDLILISKILIKYYINSNIEYSIRKMIKPSDHTPVWVNLKIF